MKLRERAGKSREEVAELLGKSAKTVGHWETGYAQPDANTLFLLCTIYDADLNESFGFSTEQTNSPRADESAPRDIFISIEQQYGSDAHKALSMYVQLDQDDRGEIRGEMKQMLKADKYKSSPCLKGETAKAV